MPPLEAGCFGYEALIQKDLFCKEMNFLLTFKFKQTQEVIFFVKEPTHITAKKPSFSDVEPHNGELRCLHRADNLKAS